MLPNLDLGSNEGFLDSGMDIKRRGVFIEDAYGGSSPHPLSTCRSCVGKIAAMISAMNSTCGEKQNQQQKTTQKLHGRNNYSHFSDRGSEASDM